MPTYEVSLRKRKGRHHKVRLEADNGFAARDTAEAQCGDAEIWGMPIEQKSARVTPRGSAPADGAPDNTDGIIFIVYVAALAPFLAIVGLPTLGVWGWLLNTQTHAGIILVVVLATLALVLGILFLLFRFLPQFILICFGFLLYGGIGFALGSDRFWGAIIGWRPGGIYCGRVWNLG